MEKPSVDTKSQKSPEQVLVDQYIAQMSEQEKLVLEIAVDHLETSFDITRSIGYKEWLEKQ